MDELADDSLDEPLLVAEDRRRLLLLARLLPFDRPLLLARLLLLGPLLLLDRWLIVNRVSRKSSVCRGVLILPRAEGLDVNVRPVPLSSASTPLYLLTGHLVDRRELVRLTVECSPDALIVPLLEANMLSKLQQLKLIQLFAPLPVQPNKLT